MAILNDYTWHIIMLQMVAVTGVSSIAYIVVMLIFSCTLL